MNKSFKEVFGFNFTDRTRPKMPKDHFLRPVTDKKQQQIVEEICCEIYKTLPTDIDLFNIIKNLPSDLALDILYSLNYGQYLTVYKMLINLYFEQFIKNVNKKDKKGVSNFDKRITLQTLKNVNVFYEERLLTLLELETVFLVMCKKDKSLYGMGLCKYEKYEGENKYIEILAKTRKKLINNKAKENFFLLQQISGNLLKDVLENLKSLNVGLE